MQTPESTKQKEKKEKARQRQLTIHDQVFTIHNFENKMLDSVMNILVPIEVHFLY